MSQADGFRARPPQTPSGLPIHRAPQALPPCLPGSDSLSQAPLPVTAPDNLILLPLCAGLDVNVTFSTGVGDAVGIEVASFSDLKVLKCKIAKPCVRNGTKRDQTWLISKVLAATMSCSAQQCSSDRSAERGCKVFATYSCSFGWDSSLGSETSGKRAPKEHIK